MEMIRNNRITWIDNTEQLTLFISFKTKKIAIWKKMVIISQIIKFDENDSNRSKIKSESWPRTVKKCG